MKKFLFCILFFVFILLILPTLIVLIFSAQNDSPESGPQVKVFNKIKDRTETVSLEKYLCGVVAAEMPASFHDEALKAQAVAARTYICNKMQSGEPNPDHPDADVCTDSTHCKAWLSEEELAEKRGADYLSVYYPKIVKSVTETCGEIITYENEPIEAVFHSAGSGRTENAADVWGGDLPYLKSVESPGDKTSPNFLSDVTVTKDEICRTLGVTDAHIYGDTRSDGGSVLTINIGGFLFRGTDIRTYFGLNSANFTVEETEDSFLFHVKGKGHGVGMSQYGANYMAENGSSYREILSAYYTGTSIEKDW